jgi:Fic family protein
MWAFLKSLDTDLRNALREALIAHWTHHSTALEGNTLTLGDTMFVLQEGLTVSGKPLKDHQEVVGHARAITLLQGLLEHKRIITEYDLFTLHKAVQVEKVVDIYAPIGAWKNEINGRNFVNPDTGRMMYRPYAAPKAVPQLMAEWLAKLNRFIEGPPLDLEKAPAIYAELHFDFVTIHPFADGNGRLARLLSNLPLLSSGLPPIVIPREQRKLYLETLLVAQQANDQDDMPYADLPATNLGDFVEFCRTCYADTQALVRDYHEMQEKRNAEKNLDDKGAKGSGPSLG